MVSGEGWHPGVIGIVATRLMEKYGRPSIVISTENGEGRGSGRAPTSFNPVSYTHLVLIRRLDRQNLFNLLQEEIIPPETAEAQKQPLLNRLLNKGGAGKHAKTNAAR